MSSKHLYKRRTNMGEIKGFDYMKKVLTATIITC